MAKNKYVFEFEVTDKGTLKLLTAKAKKAAKAVDEVGDATQRAATKKNYYNRQEKGAAQITSNSTKAFAKQAQTIGGGLVPAYATLAANIFAITAAFGALSRAAQLEQLAKGLQFTGSLAGVNLPLVANGLREITGAAVSAREAMSTVALGVSAGFSSEQLEGLTKVAKGASLALGRDMEDALSRLARGAAKLEPEILDELGIMVRLDDATETYAATIGKTAAELSQFERRQAFVNAIITQGTQKFGAIADAIEASPYDQLAAGFKSISDAGLIFINKFLGPVVGYLGKSSGGMSALTGLITIFGATVLRKAVPSLETMNQVIAENAAASAKNAQIRLKSLAGVEVLNKRQEELRKKIVAGTASIDEQREALKISRNSYIAHKNQMDGVIASHGKESDAVALKTLRMEASRRMQILLTKSTYEAAAAQIAQKSAMAASLIQQGLFREGIKAFIAAQREQIALARLTAASLSGLNKAALLAAGGFRVLKNSALFAFSAISKALPIIGQIIFAYSLIRDAISKLLPETTELDKVFAKAEEQTKQFEETNKTLARTLANESTSAVSAYRSTLTALVGEMRESANEITNIVIEIQLTAERRLQQAKEDIERLKNITRAPAGPLGSPSIDIRRTQAEGVVAAGGGVTQDEINSAILAGEVRVESLQTKIALLGAKGDVSAGALEALTRAVMPLEAATALLGDNTLSASTRLEVWKQQAAFTSTVFNGLFGSIETANQVLQDARAEFVQINKETGPFATSIKLAETALSSLKAGQFVEEGPIEQLKEFFGLFQTTPEGITQLISDLKYLNERAIHVSSALKEIDTNAINIRDKGGYDNLIAAEQATQQGLLAVAKDLDAIIANSLANKAVAVKFEAQREEILKRIAASERKEGQLLLQQSRSIVQDLQKQATVEKEILETRKALVNEAFKQLEVQRNIAKEIATAQGLGTLRPEDEYRFEIQAAQDKTKAARANLEFTKQAVAIEFELLEAKYNLLVAQANIDGQLTDQEMALIRATRDSINLQRSAAQQRAQTAQIELEAALAAEKAVTANQLLKAASSGEGTVGALAGVDLLGATARKQGATGTAEAFDAATLTAKFEFVRAAYGSLIEDLNQLGPEGEVVGALAEGALAISESFAAAFAHIEAGGSRMVAGLMVASQAVSSISAIQQAASKASIAAVDREIEAEKRRDGKSKESVSKIASLEKKKEILKKKAFEQDKKMKMAQTVINTAAGIMSAIGQAGPLGFALAGIIAALGAAQLAIISSSSYEGGGAGTASVPSKVGLGERTSAVDLASSRSPSGELAYLRGQRGVGSDSGNFVPSAFTGRAAGGSAALLVGEQGPELIIPEAPSRVVSADDTEKALGGGVRVEFQINTIDSQGVEDFLQGNRGRIIGMIREAANAHGELFLEDIR